MAGFKQGTVNVATGTSNGISRIDSINMKNSSKSLKDLEGTIYVGGVAIIEDTDEDGDEIIKGFIKDDETGICYGTVSPTALRCLSDAISLLDDGVRLAARVQHGKSNSDRDFITVIFEDVTP